MRVSVKVVLEVFLNPTQHTVQLVGFFNSHNNSIFCLGSVAVPVIQATERTDFEDGPRIVNQSEARNSLWWVRTIPENN